ncbi:MAG: IS21 family transposase, partial [Polyangiaceae bacterium]|nr:IS21 family transposase [Polyangiaceae bacterium]
MTTMVGASRAEQVSEMLPLLVRHKVQVLLEAGHAQKCVAELAGVSLATVRRVQREAAVTDVDDPARVRARGVGRPSKTTAFVSRITAWLAEDATLPTQELFRRAREAGYDGHKTALYTVVAGLRPKHDVPVVRFEGLPGEFSQHDFGHVDVRFVDGRKKRVHFFASRLKFSRFVAVELVAHERVESIVRGLARAFTSFGGLPLMAVFDRPRTIVKKSGVGRDVEAFNSTFAQTVVDLGVGVEMCAARSGNQKGAVEQLVKWVTSAFFKPRVFLDEADLSAQLAAWIDDVNTKTPSRATTRDSGDAKAGGAAAPPPHQGVSGKPDAPLPGVRRAHR